MMNQSPLLAVLLEKLREAILAGGHRQELRQQVLEGLRAKQNAPADIDALRSRVADLDKQVAHGTKRLLRAPDDIADLLAAELSKLRKERDRLARELSESEPVPAPDLEAQADALVDNLWTLGEELQKAPPARLRELVHQMVSRIELCFDRKKQGRRTVYPFVGGTVHLRPDPVLYRLVSRGDWI
jgi:chromosome segregation ATPase